MTEDSRLSSSLGIRPNPTLKSPPPASWSCPFSLSAHPGLRRARTAKAAAARGPSGWTAMPTHLLTPPGPPRAA